MATKEWRQTQGHQEFSTMIIVINSSKLRTSCIRKWKFNTAHISLKIMNKYRLLPCLESVGSQGTSESVTGHVTCTAYKCVGSGILMSGK